MSNFSRKTGACLIILVFLLGSISPTWAKLADVADEKEEKAESTEVKAQNIFGVRTGPVMRLGLKDCIDRALSYNLDLQATEYAIDAAEGKKREADRIASPVVDYEYTLAPVPQDASNAIESFFSGDLTVLNRFKTAVIFPLNTFGKVKVGKQLADVGIQAEKEKRVQKKSDIILRVQQLYQGILLSREVARLLRSAHDGIQKEIDKRENEGGTDPTEMLKLRLVVADVERKQQEGEKKAILAQEALRVTMGLASDTRFDVREDKLRPTETTIREFQYYLDQALAKRSDLRLLEYGYRAKERQVALEKRLMAPNLGLATFFEIGRTPFVENVTATDDFNDPFNFTRAGFGVQLKGQFDYHAGFAKVDQAKSELSKVNLQRDLARDGVELELKEAYLDVRNAQKDMNRAEDAGKFSRQLLFLTQSNFDLGLSESKDLIEALSTFLEVRGKYFESVFNYNLAVAKLEQKAAQWENL